MPQPYEVTAYYFPNFHPDARNAIWHGEGWTEWDLVRTATPRFPGHVQPKVSAWGEFDESDPTWAAREIDLAADHGITTFIYDWYWYDGRPYLEGGLEQGFLQAPNRDRLKFAIMWANHDLRNIFPATYSNQQELLAEGAVDAAEFTRLTDYCIQHYFTQPNYLTIDGAPYFSIYDPGTFILGMGGVEQAVQALQGLRDRVRALGFPDVHLHSIIHDQRILLSESTTEDPRFVFRELGLQSASAYTWVHFYNPDSDGFPRGDYAKAAAYIHTVEEHLRDFVVPYFPCVALGWDPSPRTIQSNPYAQRGYPWTAIFEGNTPAAFQAALEFAKDYADTSNGAVRMVMLNAWNEWTEGSYLLPDTVHGTAYLEAVRKVFSE